MRIEKLEWDSEFFGIRVGKSFVDDGDDIMIDRDGLFDLIYVFAPPQNTQINHALLQQGAILVDEKLTYVKSPFPTHSELDQIIPCQYENDEQYTDIIRIGLQSGMYSRFKIDPNFNEEDYVRLYTTWIRNSINRKIAKEVFIFKTNEIIQGIATVGEKNGRADIGIIAVDEIARGKNIGRQLIQKIEQYSVESRYSELQVITQKANKPACIFYEKCGFVIDSVVNVYHWWKNRMV